MPLLGAHMSIAGGLYKALLRGKASGCSAIQLFTSNRNRWKRRKPTADDINAFHRTAETTFVKPVAVHTSYLINLASARKEVLEKSYHTLLDELEMAELLAVPHIVMHPGSHLGDGESKGLRRVAEAISRAYGSRKLYNTTILLETTSGQGTNLGYRFEHLAEIIALVEYPDRVGVCFDTCHAFAAGYDFRSMESYEQLLNEFDRIIGLNRLYLFHINDSKSPIGSRLDRHEHIGKGHIGLKAFSLFLRDTRFAHLPFLLETPKGRDPKGKDMDVRNLQTLRNLLERAEKK
jgi:deoxyribonuclease-4